jgi:predicted outer membrane repeat protein
MKNISLYLLMACALPAHAATYFVDQDGDASDCLSWNNACNTLAAAVALSNAGVDDEIRVAQGTYYPENGIALKDKLTIRGGYNVELNLSNPDVFKTVFSGDKDGNDENKVDDITLNHADIVGSNLGRFLRADNLNDLAFEGFTITGMDEGSNGSAMWLQQSNATFNDVQFFGNKAGDKGTVFVYGNSIVGSTQAIFNDCVFSGNSSGKAGAISAHIAGRAIVNRTTFESNIAATNRGGAIALDGSNSSLEVNDSLFLNNSSVSYGGAVSIEAGAASSKLNNSTFYGNDSNVLGGAIFLANGGHKLTYLTVVNNNASTAGGGIQNDAGAENTLTASLVMGNTGGGRKNINATPGQLADGGYNLIGAAGEETEASFTFAANSNSNASAFNLNEIIEPTIDDNGGARKSVKIKANEDSTGYARNRIPFTGVPFYGVGRSADYPFTSLSQAKGALARFDNYTADIYYFDIGAVYADAASNYVVTPGVAAFSTYVDDEGFVLIKSASSGNTLGDITESTNELFLTANKQLDTSILNVLISDEERIEGLNLWRRSSAGLCDGSVAAKDSRGLPKSGFVNFNDLDQVDIIEDCDIGAFEFNDAYRLDCYDEDGDRPGITVDEDISDGTSASGTFCLNRNLLSATPAEIIDNLGTLHYGLLLLLSTLLGLRKLSGKASPLS